MCRTRYKRWCGIRSRVLMPRHVAGKSLRTPFMGVVTYGAGSGSTRSSSGYVLLLAGSRPGICHRFTGGV